MNKLAAHKRKRAAAKTCPPADRGHRDSNQHNSDNRPMQKRARADATRESRSKSKSKSNADPDPGSSQEAALESNEDTTAVRGDEEQAPVTPSKPCHQRRRRRNGTSGGGPNGPLPDPVPTTNAAAFLNVRRGKGLEALRTPVAVPASIEREMRELSRGVSAALVAPTHYGRRSTRNSSRASLTHAPSAVGAQVPTKVPEITSPPPPPPPPHRSKRARDETSPPRGRKSAEVPRAVDQDDEDGGSGIKRHKKQPSASSPPASARAATEGNSDDKMPPDDPPLLDAEDAPTKAPTPAPVSTPTQTPPVCTGPKLQDDDDHNNTNNTNEAAEEEEERGEGPGNQESGMMLKAIHALASCITETSPSAASSPGPRPWRRRRPCSPARAGSPRCSGR